VRTSQISIPVLIAMIAGSSLSASCSKKPPPDAAISKQVTEDDIREAMYRYLINDYDPKREISAYFFSITENESPDPDFMKRFTGNIPPVKTVAGFHIGKTSNEVLDNETGKRGVRLFVGDIEWISSNEVNICAGYYYNGLASAGRLYHMVLDNGKWIVKDEKLLWISWAFVFRNREMRNGNSAYDSNPIPAVPLIRTMYSSSNSFKIALQNLKK
jgi:hypothetical protein